MNPVRLAAALAVFALAPLAARADYVTLATSPSVQARWEGEWQKTHPMTNNQSAPVPRASGRCTLIVNAATRTATCQ